LGAIMTRKLLYLIGQPGAGKTTLLNAAVEDVPAIEIVGAVRLVHYTGAAGGTGAQIGGVRPGFGGTDVLPMNAQPHVVRFLAGDCGYEHVIAEGDRLGNAKFFRAVRGAGWDLTVCHLAVPDEVAARRRDERGSTQNEAWIRGRVTKVRRLAEEWAAPEWRLDGQRPLAELVNRLREHPAIAGIRGGA